jgi:DNA-binding response OmpR family regulator
MVAPDKDTRQAITYTVLLVEPYPDLRDMFYELLVSAGCAVDMAMTGYEMKLAISTTRYDCVILNIDQNREVDFGLDLAAIASSKGSRIIMIPDHNIDRETIAAKGWLQLRKPFSGSDLLAMLAQAVGPAGDGPAVQQRADEAASGVATKR